jgi:putative intracellular protease/amidase
MARLVHFEIRVNEPLKNLLIALLLTLVLLSLGPTAAFGKSVASLRTFSKESEPQAKPATKNLAILIFNGVQIIDYAGPYEVFGHAWDEEKDQALFNIYTIAEKPDPITTWMGMTVVPKYTFDNAPKPDIILLPGGNTSLELKNAKLLGWVRDRANEAEYVMSVCNGAFFLAETGLLDGKTATTFYGLVEDLREAAPKAKVVNDQRYTDNGKIITTAGLSSGIDGALHLIEKIAGHGQAQQVALNMEYNWQPDADYARASFADRYLRKIIGRQEDFKLPKSTMVKVLAQQGGRDAWQKDWELRSKLSAEELTKIIDARLSEGWTKQTSKRVSGASESTWKFKDDEGKSWTASSTVQPVKNSQNSYKLTIKLARADIVAKF